MSVPSHPQSKLGWSLDQRDPRVIQSLMPLWAGLYHFYFRVQTSGWQHVSPERPVLFVGSHNGGLAAPDMFMMMYDWFRRFGYSHPVYGLMHSLVWQQAPAVAQLAAKVGAVVAHPKMAIAALRKGCSVLVYPGGPRDVFRPHSLRHQIYFQENRAFIKLALREKVPIIPVISHGAHDTLLVLDDLYPHLQQLNQMGLPWPFGLDPQVFPVYLGLPWGLAIGPLPHIPLPVQLYTHICPPIRFEWYGPAAAADRAYVQQCYQQVCSSMQQELDQLVKSVES